MYTLYILSENISSDKCNIYNMTLVISYYYLYSDKKPKKYLSIKISKSENIIYTQAIIEQKIQSEYK